MKRTLAFLFFLSALFPSNNMPLFGITYPNAQAERDAAATIAYVSVGCNLVLGIPYFVVGAKKLWHRLTWNNPAVYLWAEEKIEQFEHRYADFICPLDAPIYHDTERLATLCKRHDDPYTTINTQCLAQGTPLTASHQLLLNEYNIAKKIIYELSERQYVGTKVYEKAHFWIRAFYTMIVNIQQSTEFAQEVRHLEQIGAMKPTLIG